MAKQKTSIDSDIRAYVKALEARRDELEEFAKRVFRWTGVGATESGGKAISNIRHLHIDAKRIIEGGNARPS